MTAEVWANFRDILHHSNAILAIAVFLQFVLGQVVSHDVQTGIVAQVWQCQLSIFTPKTKSEWIEQTVVRDQRRDIRTSWVVRPVFFSPLFNRLTGPDLYNAAS